MSNVFDKIVSIPPPFNMVVLVVLIFAVAGIVASISKELRKYACHRQDLEFKRELMDRGMSSSEINEIVQSRSDKQ